MLASQVLTAALRGLFSPVVRYKTTKPPHRGNGSFHSIRYFKLTSRASELLRVVDISLRFFAASI
jgi:hypothetical protein